MDWPASPEGGQLGDGRFAFATDRPGSIDELGAVVAARSGQGYAIYPRGGATALGYGGVPRSPGVAVDLRGLDRVVDYPAADLTITIEAGITLAQLRAILAAEGQRPAIEAPEADRATLGGIYATDASGPRRFGLGRPRDQIIGVRFVDASGRSIKGGGRVVKNVAGYDFPKLLTGSLGTLGILAELTLKVRPRPEAAAIARATYPTLPGAFDAVARLGTSATRPVSLDVTNADGGWTLAVGFEGNAEAVAWQVDRLRGELDRADFEVLEGLEAESHWGSLVDWQAGTDGPLTIKANLRASLVAGWLGRLDPARWSIQAHAGNGIARARLLEDPGLDAVAAEVDALRAEAVRLGGNLTLPRCPTAWKSRLRVWGEPESDLAIARRVKAALDPKSVLNPGRFVGEI